MFLRISKAHISELMAKAGRITSKLFFVYLSQNIKHTFILQNEESEVAVK
jgi:hypothetical protein